ncbi:MAG: adenosine kinase [Bacteroidota bacterium]
MPEILGMGNALVDIMTLLEDEKLLQTFNLPKGSMQLVDEKTAGIVAHGTSHLKQTLASGGSAANTIHGLARLGAETGFIGTIGKDQFGDFFHQDMMSSGITPHLFRVEEESGRAIALVTPDSERTFATFLGAAITLSASHLEAELFSKYKYFHIEGYLVQNQELIRKSLELAQNAGLKISLDLASFNVVEANLPFLREVTEKYVDILFANEEEAKSFTGKEAHLAVEEMAAMCDIAVVKIGKEGSYVKKAGTRHKVNSYEAQSKDTTGAGDLYASGFLFGLIKGYDLPLCGQIGSLLAANVIEVIGAKMEADRWARIQDKMEQIAVKSV